MPRKLKPMSPPDKRRVPAPGTGSSPSRAVRTGGGASANPSTSSASTNPTASTSTSASASASIRGLGVIAPPPRAALSGSSSPAPDNRDGGGGGGGGPTQPPPNTGKDGGGAGGGGGGGHLGKAANSGGSPGEAAQAQAQASRDKDDRIAGLERELCVMEGEFRRELDRLSANESEVATFWQARCGALGAELRLARDEAGALRASRDEAARELAARDAEVRALRSQVRGLKEWVSTSTRSDGQTRTSDEVFGDGMARLGNGLQNWVIVNFRRVKLDLSGADESTVSELGRLVPAYEDLAMTSKVHLLQSIVSRILVELVFDAYFVGLPPEKALQLVELEAFLSSFASSAEPINQWRSLTLTILKKGAANEMQAETSRIAETVVSRVNSILDSITEATSTEARDQALRALVTSSVELSRLLVIQKAVFKVSMPEILPHQKTMFDPSTMEDIGGEDEESLARRDICCVTFPGIIKTGDENGSHLQYRNVISKTRVLCSPE